MAGVFVHTYLANNLHYSKQQKKPEVVFYLSSTSEEYKMPKNATKEEIHNAPM